MWWRFPRRKHAECHLVRVFGRFGLEGSPAIEFVILALRHLPCADLPRRRRQARSLPHLALFQAHRVDCAESNCIIVSTRIQRDLWSRLSEPKNLTFGLRP